MKSRLVLAAALALTGAAQAAPYRLDPAKSTLEFVPDARFGRGAGQFRNFDVRADVDEADLTRSRLKVTVDVASIDTRIKKRDKHLRSADFFDAENFPIATLTVAEIVPAGPQQYTVQAELTLKGVRKTVPLSAAAHFEAGGLVVKGSGVVKRKEFGVSYDSRLNPIKDEVQVSFDLFLAPAGPEPEGTGEGPGHDQQ
jgi:polyisoprenoid-binding protein YceI